MDKEVRVRFAPSPTGYLHVGGARTALFNWLFARHHRGRFILRIEDTDFTRSSEDMVEGIIEGLRWLGLDWDEGPYFQSQRLEHYQVFARHLLEKEKAYRCFCGISENAPGKGEYTENGGKHDCADIPKSESDRRADAGEQFAVRFRVPPGRTSFRDSIFGEIEVENKILEDFVLVRSDGIPTYHLVAVADDIDMRITHVIRGADHISNTPKQLLIYTAAGETLPEFAHLPLILGPDKQRLSKRHGATSVTAYADMGYLPEAFLNFLALLGWSPGNDRELLDREELIDLFSLKGVGRADAVFGIEKLDWFNSQYLRNAPVDRLRELVIAELQSSGTAEPQVPVLDRETMDARLELLKPRMRKLGDFSTVFKAFFVDEYEYDPAACKKFLKDPKLKDLIPKLLKQYKENREFTLQSTEQTLRQLTDREKVKAGLLINAVRVALTGQGVAPSLFEVMVALGRDRTIERLGRLAEYLNRPDAQAE